MVTQANYDSSNRLVKMAHNITSSLNSERILHLIIEEVVSVITPADTGLLYLYNPEKNKLLVRSALGFKEEYTRNTQLDPGEGISGSTYLSGKSQIFNSEEEIRLTECNMSEKNLTIYRKCALNDGYTKAAISVPLKVKDEIIGVLTLDNYFSSINFTQEDLEILETAADLAAVAIVQARLIQKDKDNLLQLAEINDKLHIVNDKLVTEQALLQKTLSTHQKLNDIALKGKGFAEIIDSLATMIKLPIALYNLVLRPLAATVDAQENVLPGHIMQSPEMKNLIKGKRWQKIFCPDKQETIYLFSVVGADKMFGYLVVWVKDTDLGNIDIEALSYCALVIALEWLKQEAIFETSQKSQREFLRNILTEKIDEELLEQARSNGFEQDDQYVVLLVKPFDRTNQGGKNTPAKIYLIESLLDTLENKKMKGMIIPERNHYCILLSFGRSEHRNIADMVYHFSETILKIYPESHMAYGRVYQGIKEISKSYQEAKQGLTIRDKYSYHAQIIDYSKLGIIGLIYKQKEDDLISFLNDMLLPVIQYDQKKETELLLTLFEYVHFNRSLHLVAEKLNMHFNTVYTRIKKVEELLDMDFNDIRDWQNIQLACTIYELVNNVLLPKSVK